jgi:uncharacterized protein (DUF885 family)
MEVFMSKKQIIFFPVLLIYFGIIIFCNGCNKQINLQEIQNKFDTFTNDIFKETVESNTLSINYTLKNPDYYGIEYDEISLGNYNAKEMQKHLSISENHLEHLSSFDYNALCEKQQLTYQILKNYLKQNLKLGKYLYYTECLGPVTGIQAQLPILLAEYNFYEKSDIDQYIALLSCVDDYFEEIAQFEREKSRRGLFMNDIVADSIIEQCEAFIKSPIDNYLITYFNKKIADYNGLTTKEIDTYQKANQAAVLSEVIPAYKNLINTLRDLKGTGNNKGGLCYYPKGQEYYASLTAYKTGSEKSMKKIIKMLETAYSDNLLKMAHLLRSDPSLEKKYENFTSFPITDPQDILTDLKNNITIDFPKSVPVSCTIKYIDESLAEYVSPAMYLVPAIDNYKENSIYINGDDEQTLSQIYTTVAHEGYPGHLYQCVYFRSSNPAPIRNILDFIGYDEGWATYVEMYSYHLAGIDESLANFLEAYDSINLCLCARADIGIHYEGWTPEQVSCYTGDQTSTKALYNTLLMEPAAYLPYAVGYLEIMELKKKAEDQLGDQFMAKNFHEFLLDIGPAQFNVINDYMDIWIAKQKKH